MTAACNFQALVASIRTHVCEYLNRFMSREAVSGSDDATTGSRRRYSFQLVEESHEIEKAPGDKIAVNELLNEIHHFLELPISVDKAMELVPEIGQVLGRLCAIPVVTGSPALYQQLMDCVFALYRQHPNTPMEAKARKWALNQFKNTTACSEYKNWPYHHLYSTTQNLQERKLKQNVSTIVKLVEGQSCCNNNSNRNSNNSSSNSTNNCWSKSTVRKHPYCHRKSKAAAEHLCRVKQVAQVLLLSLHPSSEFWPAWDAILRFLALQPLDAGIEEIYLKLQENLQDLPYSTKTLLWRSYLPALEASVLSVVDTVCLSAPLPSAIRDVLSRSLLPRACAEESSIYMAVCSMLHTLLRNSGGCSLVADVMTELTHSVHSLIQTAASNHQVLPVVLPVPCPGLQSLAVLLRASPADMSPEVAERHLMRICDVVSGLGPDEGSSGDQGDGLLLLLLHHREWWWHAVWQILAAPAQKVEKLASFVCAFFKGANLTDLKSGYLEVVGRLQAVTGVEAMPAALEDCLELGNGAAMDDSLSDQRHSSTQHHPLLCQTLLALLLRSPAPVPITPSILAWVTSSTEKSRHLAALVHAHWVFPMARLHWSGDTRSQHCQALQTSTAEVRAVVEGEPLLPQSGTQQLLQESEKLLEELAAVS